ncbi:MAG: hypothetical protein ABI612_23290 [Betaproteobacteria bacterium]
MKPREIKRQAANRKRWLSHPFARTVLLIGGLASATFAYSKDFEQRCAAQSREAHISVVFENAVPTLIKSKRALDMPHSSDGSPSHRSVGLTEAKLRRHFSISLNGTVDSLTGVACGKADIQIRLRYDPFRVYLAAELDGTHCLQQQVLEHELIHVRLFNAAAQEAAAQLRIELIAHFSNVTLRGREADVLQEVQSELNRRWIPRLDELLDQFDEKHVALDFDVKARADRICPGLFDDISKRIEQ